MVDINKICNDATTVSSNVNCDADCLTACATKCENETTKDDASLCAIAFFIDGYTPADKTESTDEINPVDDPETPDEADTSPASGCEDDFNQCEDRKSFKRVCEAEKGMTPKDCASLWMDRSNAPRNNNDGQPVKINKEAEMRKCLNKKGAKLDDCTTKVEKMVKEAGGKDSSKSGGLVEFIVEGLYPMVSTGNKACMPVPGDGEVCRDASSLFPMRVGVAGGYSWGNFGLLGELKFGYAPAIERLGSEGDWALATQLSVVGRYIFKSDFYLQGSLGLLMLGESFHFADEYDTGSTTLPGGSVKVGYSITDWFAIQAGIELFGSIDLKNSIGNKSNILFFTPTAGFEFKLPL